MAKVLGRRWVRLWWDSGTTPVRICAGSRSVSSSSAVPAAAAAAAAAAHTRAVDHIEQGSAVMRVRVQEDSASSTATMSEKARGKQRARSSEELDSGTSPYMRGSRLHATFGSDMDELTRLASSADGPESARAWLEVLQNPAASYSTSAPYLLTQGAFYCSPLQGAGGRGFLARLHCHLLACQIHSAADAELALKMLKRHLVLGNGRPRSGSAWPHVYGSASGSSASTSGGSTSREAQQSLFAAFSRNHQSVVDAAAAVLERVLRDLGAAHLVTECTTIVVQLSMRFRQQIGPARAAEAGSRHTRDFHERSAEQSRWLRKSSPTGLRPRSRKLTKVKAFEDLTLRLAHLLPHNFDRRHQRAAILLLKAIILLCNVHTKARSMRDVSLWPSLRGQSRRWTLLLFPREQKASMLPRERVQRRGIFSARLCCDVARALLDAPSNTEPATDAELHPAPWPTTRPYQPYIIDSHGDHIPNILGLRSQKRRGFLTYELAHACVLAVAASVRLRQSRWTDPFRSRHLTSTDYDAVIRAIVLNGREGLSLIRRAQLARTLVIAAEKAQAREEAWLSRPQSRARLRLGSSRLYETRTALARQSLARTNLLLPLHCRIAFFSSHDWSDNVDEHALRAYSGSFVRSQIYHRCIRGHRGFFARWPVLFPKRASARELRPGRLSDSVSQIQLWRHAVAAFTANGEVTEEVALTILGSKSTVSSFDANDPQARLDIPLPALRDDAASFSTAILGFAASKRWPAVEQVWDMALAQRVRMPAQSFDRVVQAYLRSQRLRARQALPGNRKHILGRAFAQVTAYLREQEESSEPRAGPSAHLAHEIVHYVGNLMVAPQAALGFWQAMLERQCIAATGSRVLAGMLGVARTFELGTNNARPQVRDDAQEAVGGSVSGFGTASLGMWARQVFRNLLFEQHPSLRGLTFDLSSSFGHSISDDVAHDQDRSLALGGLRRYINFDQRVLEAYFELIHTMLIPQSIVGRSSGVPYSPAQGSIELLRDGSWMTAFLGDAARGSDPNPLGAEGLAVTEPVILAKDEAIRVLRWMRALDLRPSASMLCFVSVHLRELVPRDHTKPQSKRRRTPTGRLHGWLSGWLGREALPTEKDVAVWLRKRQVRALAEDELLV